jgi:hypothetical protein
MFGHRPVGWGRHAGAVFGAAFVSSSVQAVVGVATALLAARMGGLPAQPLAVVLIGTVLLWIGMFLIVMAQVGLFFTIARGLLTLASRNFGAAYLALGLVMGVIEANVIGTMKGAMAPRDFVFAAATGVLSGFVYWLIAARDKDVAALEMRAEAAAAFR